MTVPFNDLEERWLRRLVEQHQYERAEVHEIRPIAVTDDSEPEPIPVDPALNRERLWRPL